LPGRLKKNKVDYFPHYCKHGKTLYILENQYGNDGYAFWFKTLEILGDTVGHHFDCSDIVSWQYLLATTRVKDETARAILKLLADLGAIDKEIWDRFSVIWSANFVNNISEAYRRRESGLLGKNDIIAIYDGRNEINVNKKSKNDDKKRESKVYKRKEYINANMHTEIVCDFNEVTSSRYKTNPVTKDIAELINARISEGFTVDDFKRVHRQKFESWGNDPKMRKYLRPHTLYTAKFQAYLNEVPASQQVKPLPAKIATIPMNLDGFLDENDATSH